MAGETRDEFLARQLAIRAAAGLPACVEDEQALDRIAGIWRSALPTRPPRRPRRGGTGAGTEEPGADRLVVRPPRGEHGDPPRA